MENTSGDSQEKMQIPLRDLLPLIGDVVHRLNNPIGAAKVRVELLKYKISKLLTEDEYIDTSLSSIGKNLDDALEILGELKEALKTPRSFQIEPTSVSLSIGSAISGIDIPREVKIINKVDGPLVLATKHLADVFRNLVVNAIEAMPEGGILTIYSELNTSDNSVHVLFSDTGRGIPKYMHTSLFRPYFSTKEKKGHGVGLWWSKAYLQSIGANIELVFSEVGKGSTFKVSIPSQQSV